MKIAVPRPHPSFPRRACPVLRYGAGTHPRPLDSGLRPSDGAAPFSYQVVRVATLMMNSERSEESSLPTIDVGLAHKVFRLLTPLRYVRNDNSGWLSRFNSWRLNSYPQRGKVARAVGWGQNGGRLFGKGDP